jgi:O-antigen biosynthesis protein
MNSNTSTHSGLVSIITPCFNASTFLEPMRDSVAAQTYAQIEHIIIDDASTDNSREVIKSFGRSVRTVHLGRNRGGSYARNCGADIARGAFLMFLDADDIISPTTIESLVNAAEHDPTRIHFCPWRRLRLIRGKWRPSTRDVPYPDPDEDALSGWLRGVWVPTCSVLWPRDIFDLVGGWREQITLNDDGDIMMRALSQGIRLNYVTGGESFYRAHDPQRLSVSTAIQSLTQLASHKRVLDDLHASLRSRRALDRYSHALGHAYFRLSLTAHQQGQVNFASECRACGNALGYRTQVSPTRIGGILESLIGIDRKELLAVLLARAGVATRGRRALIARRLAGQPTSSIFPRQISDKGDL